MKTSKSFKMFKRFSKFPMPARVALATNSKSFVAFTFCVLLSLTTSHIVSANGVKEAKSLQEAFNNVAEKAFPSVVVITTKKEIERRLPPFIEQFFEYYGKKKGRQEPPPVVEGKGSGFFISDDGYIVTNHHVIAEMDEIIVQTKDRKEYKAEVRGSDPKTDVALLKINATEKFPTLDFADSDKVKIGDWAIAIGAPYNLDYTMTVGIVSQTGRSVGLNAYENYIQTDASINRGNSGGPLLDIDGKVIGVNDFIFTSGLSEGNIGLGFAIPSNMAKDVVEQLKAKGEVIRPWIGIAMEMLNPEMKEQFSAEEGVLVREVFSGNPADKAGIEPGDIIVSIDNISVATPKDVQMQVLKKKPGEVVRFKIIRNGKNLDIDVIPELQDSASAQLRMPEKTEEKLLSEIGIALSEKEGSIIVTKVFPNTNAEIAGMKQGMEILAVNKQKVSSISDIVKAIDKKKQNSVLFYVSTGKGKAFIVVKMPK